MCVCVCNGGGGNVLSELYIQVYEGITSIGRDTEGTLPLELEFHNRIRGEGLISGLVEALTRFETHRLSGILQAGRLRFGLILDSPANPSEGSLLYHFAT